VQPESFIGNRQLSLGAPVPVGPGVYREFSGINLAPLWYFSFNFIFEVLTRKNFFFQTAVFKGVNN